MIALLQPSSSQSAYLKASTFVKTTADKTREPPEAFV